MPLAPETIIDIPFTATNIAPADSFEMWQDTPGRSAQIPWSAILNTPQTWTTVQTFVAPVLGNALATTINKITMTAPATGATLTIADGKTLTCSNNANVSGTNTGDQTITLTGNVTGTGTGSFPTTITNGAVTNAMLAGSITASKLTGSDIATVGTITAGTWNGTTIAIANGGTGQTTAANAINALLPSQTGNSGKFLTTNGSVASWDIPAGGGGGSGTVTSVATNATLTGGTITTSGTLGINLANPNTWAAVQTFVAPVLGAASATSINKVAITAPGTSATLTIADGKTLTCSNDATVSGTNTGDQTITLTGNVTGSGTGSISTTIAAGAVTNAMLAGSIVASNLVGSDIATVGTITAGTWTGTTIAIANGGTGQTTAANAINALLPTQTSNSGKFLTTNGTVASWGSPGTVTSVAIDATLTGGTITTTGTLGINLNNVNTWAAVQTFVAPVLGAASATSINKVTITTPATGSTLTIVNGATLTCSATASVSGTNTGDQTITLTGNVTGTGTGSFATTIASGVVTNAMLAGSIAASKLVGSDIATVGTITAGTWTGTTIAIANGGTGQTTAANAINALLPSQTSNSGKFLTTNGTVASWGTGNAGTVTSVAVDSTLTGGAITTTGTLGINLATTNTWTAPININLNASSLPTPLTGTLLQIAQVDTTPARVEVNAYGAQAFFSGVAWGGTKASPTALAANTQIGGFNFYGYNGAVIVGPVATFRAFTSETWSNTGPKQGSYAEVAVTATAGSTLTSSMRWENDGGVTLPSTVTGGSKGAGTINVSGGYYVNGTILSGTGTVTSVATNATLTGGTITTTGTLALNLANANTWTAIQTYTPSGGALNTNADAIICGPLITATGTTNQGYSGSARFTCSAWKSTATAAAQLNDWIVYALPVTAGAVSSSTLRFDSQNQTTGGGYFQTFGILASTSGGGAALVGNSGGAGVVILGGNTITPSTRAALSSNGATLSVSSTTAAGNLNFQNFGTTVLSVQPSGTLVSAASLTWNGVNVPALTVTLSGSTNITTAAGLNLVSIAAPILSAGSALTVTNSASLTILGAPTGAGAGPCTITNAYSLWIQAGTTKLGGSLLLGNAAVTGLTAGVLSATTNASIVISDSTGQAYRIPCII